MSAAIDPVAVQRFVDPPTLSTTTEEYLTWLAVEQGRSRNTIIAYRRDLLAYEGFLARAGRGVADAELASVEEFLEARRAEGLAPASLARAVAAVRGLHRFALEEGATTVDPTADLLTPRIPARLPKALDEAEVTRLLDGVWADDPVSLRDRAVVEVLYSTGMRVGELVGLALTDLNHDRGMLRVLGKGDKERLVPLGRLGGVALERWLGPGGRVRLVPLRWARRGDAEAVFLNTRGRRLSRQGVWGVLKLRAEGAGLDPARVYPHVLRHSCATHMLARGADVRVVQELLGHVSIATTQAYTKVSTDHLRRAYEAAHPRAQGADARPA